MALQLGHESYVTPVFSAGQSPSALGIAAFQDFLFDLTHASCVSDLAVVSGVSLTLFFFLLHKHFTHWAGPQKLGGGSWLV